MDCLCVCTSYSFSCLLSSVLESWMDYTGELEPPEPLSRLPQLKHRMKRLLSQLGKVQQIALYSSTWGHQRTAAAPSPTQHAEKVKPAGSWLQNWWIVGSFSTSWYVLLLFFVFWKGSFKWNLLLHSASVIWIFIWTFMESQQFKSGMNTQSNLKCRRKSFRPDITPTAPVQP